MCIALPPLTLPPTSNYFLLIPRHTQRLEICDKRKARHSALQICLLKGILNPHVPATIGLELGHTPIPSSRAMDWRSPERQSPYIYFSLPDNTTLRPLPHTTQHTATCPRPPCRTPRRLSLPSTRLRRRRSRTCLILNGRTARRQRH